MNQDVTEEVIDALQDSKADILSTALVARSWVSRSRHHLAKNHWPNLDIKSFEDMLHFIHLIRSPNSTLVRLSKTFEQFSLDSSSAAVGPLRLDSTALIGEGMFPFLRTTTVSCSLKINLDHLFLQPTQISPFPWDVIDSWKSLSCLSITAVLPRLNTMTSLLLGLPRLRTVELDVDYLDKSVPQPSHHHPHLQQLRSLHLGPRGYAAFAWLAILPPDSLHLDAVSIIVGDEDFSPFQAFARSGTHRELIYLQVSLRRNIAAELGACLPVFSALSEMALSVQFYPTPPGCVDAIISGLDNGCLEHLRLVIPSKLAIPWRVDLPVPNDSMRAEDLRSLKMRNHAALSGEDQKQVQMLNHAILSYLRKRRSSREGSGHDEELFTFDVGVYPDRGVVPYS